MKIKLGVIFGGKSVEHDISIITGNQAMSAVNEEKYEIVPIYISKEGLFYTGDYLKELEHFKDLEEVKKQAIPIVLVRDENKVNLIRYPMKKFGNNIVNSIDIAFPTMHGTNGEDGTIAGYLEMLSVPYIGCDVLSASIGMDKIMMRRILKEQGISSLDYVAFYTSEYLRNSEEQIGKIEKSLVYPVIVKAGNLGSSVGIKKAKDRKELEEAIEFAMEFSDRVMIEHAITNLKEVNCSVIGDTSKAKASVCEEPISSDEILSYQDKYMSGGKTGNKTGSKIPMGEKQGMASLQRKLPAEITEEMRDEIQEMAVKTFQVLGCNGVSRIDFLVDNDTNEVYVNEINTIPGALSFYLWEATGESFEKEIDELVELAMKRSREKENRIFSYDKNILSLSGSKTGMNK